MGTGRAGAVVDGAVGDGEVDLAALDLADLDVFADGFPHAAFTCLRRDAPVWWNGPTAHTPDGVGFWVVSRHADALTVAGDPATFSSERAPGAAGGGTILADLPYGFAAGVLLNMMDDPRHHRIRRLLTPALAPRALAELEPELEARANAILDGLDGRDECDFLTDVAVELPLQALAALLGVPEGDRHQLLAWSNATLDHEGRELGEDSAAAAAAAAAMAAYGNAFVAERRRCPAGDLTSVMATANVEGDDGAAHPLTDLELQMFFALMVAAGSETTRNSLALGLAALVDHRDQLAALDGDRSLLPGAVEEILRWTSATLYNRRTATADTVLGGQPVRAGDKVTVWWASANRDEAVFADPFRFDITRSPNPHLAFGSRTHHCVGAGLARMELRVMLAALLDRFVAFELAGPVRRVRTNKHAGVASMPVALRRR